jgi:hypothetical protein
MKKFAVISLVVLMLALSVVPAFAKGPAQGGGSGTGICTGSQTGTGTGAQNNFGSGVGLGTGSQYAYGPGMRNGFGIPTPYAFSGIVTAVDDVNFTVTISVACGNNMANPYIGQQVTVLTTDGTRYLLLNANGTVTPITFSYLDAGQNVSIHASLLDGDLTATRITSGALLECLP